MRKLILIYLLSLCIKGNSQELYPSTEPASNMAAGSMGLRINTGIYQMPAEKGNAYRVTPELMLGVSKKWMVHLDGYASNMYQDYLKWEGESIYAKYRFFSSDDVHSHFRMAAFGKFAWINNPGVLETQKTFYTNENGQLIPHSTSQFYTSDEINLDGNNSGFETGIIATRLVHKFAISSTLSFLQRLEYPGKTYPAEQSDQALDYSVSAGWLVLPRVYRDFRQTNLNLYCEFLGSSSLDKKSYYLDVAPAVQFIFNSISRLDLSYRAQLIGNMERLSKNEWSIRFEYNFLNLFKNSR